MTELAYQQRARQEAIEYGTFRAKYPILHDGVIAYQPGSAVPISNVKLYGYDRDGLVQRVDGQPVDAPLPDGHAPLVEAQPAGEGWIDGPSPSQPEPLPQGEPVQLGEPAEPAVASPAVEAPDAAPVEAPAADPVGEPALLDPTVEQPPTEAPTAEPVDQAEPQA